MHHTEINGKWKIIVLSIVISGAFLSSLGQSLLTSSIPILSKIFNVSEATGEWLTTVYILTLGVVSAMTACLINSVPTRKLFLGGIFLLMFGCVCSLFAPNFTVLLLSRVIQAFGAGVLMPLTQVLVLSIYPRERHGRAFAAVGLVVSFAPAIGPTLAGVMVDLWGWKSIFYLMLTIASAVFTSGCLFLKNIGKNFPDKIDIFSVFLYGAGFCALMAGISEYSEAPSEPLRFLVPIAFGAFLLYIFSLRSLKIEHPLLNIRILGQRDFAVSFVIIVIAFIASMSSVMLLPLYLQTVRGLSETVSGLVLLPGALSILAANPLSGKILDSKGPRLTTLFGMALMLAGTIGFCVFDKETPLSIVAVFYCIRAFGMTMAMTPLTAYCVGSLQGAQVSHGNAIITSLRQMFGTLGATALVTVTVVSSETGVTDVRGINTSFAVQTVLFAAGLILAITFIKKRVE